MSTLANNIPPFGLSFRGFPIPKHYVKVADHRAQPEKMATFILAYIYGIWYRRCYFLMATIVTKFTVDIIISSTRLEGGFPINNPQWTQPRP